jgi:HemY protein
MTRILFFVLFIVAAALGLAWLADRPGTVTVEWLGYQIETSAFVAALVLAALVSLFVLAFAVLRYVWTRPAAMAAYVRERRQQQGLEALSRGLLAIGVGDRTQAQRYAGIASRNLPREPLTALLRAQAAQLKGDPAAARRAFEGMLDQPETQLLGVRGLFLEAKRSNDEDAARALAEQAVERDPKLAWGVNALFDLQARAGDWDGAMNTLAIARQNGHVETDAANRRRAVLLTAEAREAETFDPDKALTLANEALRLAPSLVPAAALAGRLFASKGEARAASRQIVRTWKLSPHPDLAVAYAFAKPGLSPKDRLKRVEYLAGLTPDDIEGPIAVAQAAIDAQEWQEARDVLAPYVEERPSARICTLMARIEGGSGDKGREREWLARAVRAPRDRAWIADGYVSDRWLPVSPVTGQVDAFQWKAPVDAIGRGDDTLRIAEDLEPPRDASAMATLPPAETSEPAVVVDVTPSVAEVVSKPPQAEAEDADEPASQAGKAETSPAATAGPKVSEPESGYKADRSASSDSSDFIPIRPPDDPGVSQPDTDESPTSLERLRAAQIR